MAGFSPYRERALQHYSQNNVVATLPRFVSLRNTVYLWGMLLALLIVVGIAWLGQVPSFTTSSGIVLSQKHASYAAGIYLFLPIDQLAAVHKGDPIQIQVGSMGPSFSTSVASVQGKAISPTVARQQFGLGSSAWGVITEPSLVLEARAVAGFSLQKFSGSVLNARIQIGSHPVLALLPGIGSLLGGNK
ncbi:hypothetical protein [Dictyobacter arantiisoli]|uniref:Uncharacterized protein n=1 Tax=Dictyobacter arantiisoli TaxID=2014874 RepID=A0A5A5T7C9_9CHLR|nr:hypothetical protein [Dictyobacter arantiisoli]GCF06903.1 hypothetical protein KDI_04670 [Dictyobacter arantiisoli]